MFIFGVGLIGGAGYLGRQSGQSEAKETIEAPTTVAVTRGDVQLTVTTPGQLVGTQEMLLSFAVSGQLAEICVQPGQAVKKGQILARLKTEAFEAALKLAQLKFSEAHQQHQYGLAQAKLQLRMAQAELNQERAKATSLNTAQAAVVAAQAELQELMAGPNPDKITVAAAELNQAEITLKQDQLLLSLKSNRQLNCRPHRRKCKVFLCAVKIIVSL